MRDASCGWIRKASVATGNLANRAGIEPGSQSLELKSTSYCCMTPKSPISVARERWRYWVVGGTGDTRSPMGYVLPSGLPPAVQAPFAWRLLQRMTHQLGNRRLSQAKAWVVLRLSKLCLAGSSSSLPWGATFAPGLPLLSCLLRMSRMKPSKSPSLLMLSWSVHWCLKRILSPNLW